MVDILFVWHLSCKLSVLYINVSIENILPFFLDAMELKNFPGKVVAASALMALIYNCQKVKQKRFQAYQYNILL